MKSGWKGEGEVGEEEEEEEEEVMTEGVWWQTILHFRSVRKVGGEDPVVSPAPAPAWSGDN